MGLIFSRFKKKVATKERLQQIQQEIDSIQEFKLNTEQQAKKFVGSFVIYSLGICFITAIVVYLSYLPPTWQEKLLYMAPFAEFLLLIYFIKKILTWYYGWKVNKNEKKLHSLKEEKTMILNQVMETETYKAAKEILEMYAPDQLRKTSVIKTSILGTSAAPPLSQGGELRRRIVSYQQEPQPVVPTPRQTPIAVRNITPVGGNLAMHRPIVASHSAGQNIRMSFSPSNTSRSHDSNASQGQSGAQGPPGPPMPRPVMPRERGYLDRFVEYLVGDGPANRYALICRQCESHNGMALKEEFEYIAFRCAYCFYWNPARKQRPTAPRLETLVQRSPSANLLKEFEAMRKEEEEGSSEEVEKTASSEDNEAESVSSSSSSVEVAENQEEDDEHLWSSESSAPHEVSGDESAHKAPKPIPPSSSSCEDLHNASSSSSSVEAIKEPSNSD